MVQTPNRSFCGFFHQRVRKERKLTTPGIVLAVLLCFQRNEFLHPPSSLCCRMEICFLLSDVLYPSRELHLHIQQEQ